MPMSIILSLLLLQAPYALPGEAAVDPYVADNRQAGAVPFTGDGMAKAFGGQDGIRRIVDRFVAINFADPVIGEIFANHDKVRLKRTLFEQFCFILNAGCTYSGRDMASAHKDLGVQKADMNRLVETLQRAMSEEGVSFQAQNRFLSKLAPMRHDVIEK
ncbi:MAG: group I truncated hemoglobin [Pseudomonadota bacterium]|uniref:Group 1 truncated hemoglobin n=1 Tax=Sphingobium xenophagum TaxID=121428 RepID=A0A249MUD0_SPHXE|nr:MULTISPECIES: group 1 truncated hemoglobin [Sphingobium]ASY44784.1 group 1 truncated hemoglobin [Sphingobium xenophagum]OUC53969.1 group 1 truncated hemoglobin [Sphingobium sp. GW456-12-10-14-TSB1]QWT14872.1 group 1 truncated hemoglobin [Sphingobium xenophagum]